ncbi:MAG: hypothetical protein GY719_41060 [bacterium]|nr:hypothetical protein [bacterium]
MPQALIEPHDVAADLEYDAAVEIREIGELGMLREKRPAFLGDLGPPPRALRAGTAPGSGVPPISGGSTLSAKSRRSSVSSAR